MLWCVGKLGKNLRLGCCFHEKGEWDNGLESWTRSDLMLIPSWVWGEWVSVMSYPISTKTLGSHNRASLFSNAAMITLTKGIWLFWAIACSAHSTSWLYLPGFCQDCFPSHSVMYLKLRGFGCHIFSRSSWMHSCNYTSACVRLSRH